MEKSLSGRFTFKFSSNMKLKIKQRDRSWIKSSKRHLKEVTNDKNMEKLCPSISDRFEFVFFLKATFLTHRRNFAKLKFNLIARWEEEDRRLFSATSVEWDCNFPATLRSVTAVQLNNLWIQPQIN